jgi:hypothetical protein
VKPSTKAGIGILARSVFLASFTLLTIGIGVMVAAPGSALDSNLYLIALAGQSNMTGSHLNRASQLPAGFPANGSRIWNFTNANTWELAKEPVDDNYKQVDTISRDKHPGVGPALAMADAFAAKYSRVRVGLIPCAKSGSSIQKWQPNLSRSTLYGSCLYRQKQAEQRGKMRALVFWQGGQEAKTKEAAQHWGENFTKMVSAWRSDVGNPTLPVILLVMRPGTARTLAKYPYTELVRQQQLSVQMPYLTKVDTSRYEYYNDDVHMTTLGQLALGPAIAAALPAP